MIQEANIIILLISLGLSYKNMKTSNKINIALLGCGRISKSHINAIVSEKDRCHLVAICDESKEKIKSASQYIQELFYKKGINIQVY